MSTEREANILVDKKTILLCFLVLLILLFSIVISSVQISYGVNNQLTKEDFTLLEGYHSDVKAALEKVKAADDAEVDTAANAASKKLDSLIQSLKDSDTNNDPTGESLIKQLNEISSQMPALRADLKGELSGERKIALSKLEKMNQQVAALKEKAKSKDDPGKLIYGVITSVGDFLVKIIYPLLILVIIFLLVFSRSGAARLSGFLSQFKSVKFFSTEFVLNEATKIKAEETLETYRSQVVREYDLYIQRSSVNKIFEKVSEEFIKFINEELAKIDENLKLKDYRCTLHVPDLLFAETFYQLLDYYTDGTPGKTHGRTWSFRFGIIGKVWRSGNYEITEQVPTDKNELIQSWGMTAEEAERAGKGRQSFLCVLIKDNNGVDVGMFYMDAKDKYAFTGMSNEENIKKKIRKELELNFETALENAVADDYNKRITDGRLQKPEGQSDKDFETQSKAKIKAEHRKIFSEKLDEKIADEFNNKTQKAIRQETKDKLEKRIRELCKQKSLDAILVGMKKELGGRAPLIRIYNEY